MLGPAITGTVSCSARAIRLASPSSSPPGPHSVISSRANGTAASTSGRSDGAQPATAATSSATTNE